MFQYVPDYINKIKNPVNILHIGANYGQETESYINNYSDTLKSITYIECIPSVFEKLVIYNKQFENRMNIKYINALCSDKDHMEVEFYVTNNNGLSSSVFKPNLDNWQWSDVNVNTSILLKTITINKLIEDNILFDNYDTLIIDTQGSELKILKGADKILKNVKQCICEYSSVEYYKGGAMLNDLIDIFTTNNFIIDTIDKNNSHGDIYCYKLN